MTDKIVVLSTCATEEEAAKLARVLVEARVAACVTMVPGARSVYRWQEAIESAAGVPADHQVVAAALRTAADGSRKSPCVRCAGGAGAAGSGRRAPNYMNWLEGQLGA